MPRPESIWLTLRAGLKDLLLEEHHQPYSLFKHMRRPDQQTPQMIMLLGHNTKTWAMGLLRFGSRPYETLTGAVHLRLDDDTSRSESPVFFADCELHNSSNVVKAESESWVGDVVQRPLTWYHQTATGLDSRSLAHLVYAKLLAPFSNVICFFAEDFGGLQDMAEILAVWLISFSNRPSDLAASTYPRVIVMVRSDDWMSFDENAATKEFLKQLGAEAEAKNGVMTGELSGKLKKAKLDKLLQQQFGGMRVVAFPGLDSTSREWRSLRARLLRDSKEIQERRREARVCFSAQHFKAFFHMASDHFCSTVVAPFSFIKASRVQNPVPAELAFHVGRFLKRIDQRQLLNFAVPMIASVLMFDNYPSGMHGFHPILVFRRFYYHLCLSIDPFRTKDKTVGVFTSPQLAHAIETAFCEMALQIINCDANDITLHQRTLARFKDVWRNLYDNVSCLSCLSRAPEDTLDCHHSLCMQCTRTYGQTSELEPWIFYLNECPLCGKPNRTPFSHKPDTAGVRAIIAEGGGIKGVIPLTFLKELQNMINLPMEIHEHFDVAFGSSSGALIILGLFINRWPVEECSKQFQTLSALAFKQRGCFGLPFLPIGAFLSSFLQVVTAFVRDSRYSSVGITKALKYAFGDASRLFDAPAGGAKVAVVATTTKDSATCIFTNYNGPGNRTADCGYRMIRPENADKEQLVWQAARASSAAPPYFQSFRGFQDGGLGGHNNPINLALWEQDNIWSRHRKQPDVVLSLGTGYKRDLESDEEKSAKTSFFRDRCVPRLFRSFLNFFVGESRWQELQNSLPPQVRERYHRMNIEFYGDEPQLDDIQAIPSLQQQAQFRALSGGQIKSCADNLLASLFYLELVRYPEFDRTSWMCQGRIRCRLGPSHEGLRILVERLKDTRASFYLDFQQALPCLDAGTYQDIEMGQPFCLNVTFKVHSLQDFVDIKLERLTKRPRSISNCPYKVKTLISDQSLDKMFGYRGGKRPRKTHLESERQIKRAKLVK